jgi:hypothetical protein
VEWAVIAMFAVIAAVAIGLARERDDEAAPDLELLREQRRTLLDELRDLDEDSAAGRISPEDRLAGRRALAPRLRAVTEALREAGDEREATASGEDRRDAEAPGAHE